MNFLKAIPKSWFIILAVAVVLVVLMVVSGDSTQATTWSASSDNEGYGTCERGDVNADGVVSVDDVTFLVDYIYYGGPAPQRCFWNAIGRNFFYAEYAMRLPDGSVSLRLHVKNPLLDIAFTEFGDSGSVVWLSRINHVHLQLVMDSVNIDPRDLIFFEEVEW